MKNNLEFVINITIMLCVVLVIALIPTEKEGAIYNDTVRLHILANSDSYEDQRLKLEIRDKLLQKYSEKLGKSATTDAAIETTKSLVTDMQNDVNLWLNDAGADYDCDVKIGIEWYETRSYDRFTLPCGYYTSLQVTLGNAKGQNWWCVMYPPLCLDMATDSTCYDDAIFDYTKAESTLISAGEYNIKFKLLEIISESVAFSSKND